MKDIQCKKCAHFTPEWCEFKRDSLDPDLMRDCEYYKAKTNADRIRSMTDEELMEFLEHDYWSIDYCKKDAPIDQETKECLLPSCKQCWLEWLKQEADE